MEKEAMASKKVKKISVKKKIQQPWFVYMLRCADTSLYTGITTDLERRMREHNDVRKGAKYTRARQPVVIVYSKKVHNRSEASTEEASLKKLSRREKLELIERSRQKTV
jgi:putative endonuclease